MAIFLNIAYDLIVVALEAALIIKEGTSLKVFPLTNLLPSYINPPFY